MARVVGLGQGRVNVRDLPHAQRATAERLYGALDNDFRLMKAFRYRNSKAALAPCDDAWIAPDENMFVVEIRDVANVNLALAATEAGEYGATVTFVRNQWLLSVPLPAATSASTGMVTTGIIALVFILVIGFVWPPLGRAMLGQFMHWMTKLLHAGIRLYNGFVASPAGKPAP